MSVTVSEIATAGSASLFVLETGVGSDQTAQADPAPIPSSGQSFFDWAMKVVNANRRAAAR